MKYKLIEEEINEALTDKVEDFSEDEEILCAYDGEWHRQEVARVVVLDKIEKAKEQGIKQGSQKEKNKIVKNMLKENLDKELISKVTGLNIEQINWKVNNCFPFFTNFDITVCDNIVVTRRINLWKMTCVK